MDSIVRVTDQTESRRQVLGTLRRDLLDRSTKYNSYGWTVTLSPKMRILRKDIRPSPPSLRTKMMKWGDLNIDQQINFLIDYIHELQSCPLFPTHKGLYTGFELNESKNIHAHIIVFTDYPKLDVINLQKLTRQHVRCQRLHLGRDQHRLNYIHELDPPEQWIEYITKDYIQLGRNYYIDI